MKTRHILMASAALLASAGAAAAQMPSPEEAKCGALRGISVSADQIGEPTSGADIYSATLIKGDQAAGGGFCKVLGGIDPVDPNAPDINFQINLPLEWNNKAIQYGGGGYDGSLVEAVGNVSFGADDAATPLQRGYVTYGSDSGHQTTSSLDGSFMMNDESLANYGGLQIKKTHDVTMAVINAYFEKAPEKSYIQGNSQGGHEALIGIQRWPDDYDGALVTHPANPIVMLQLAGNHYGKAFYDSEYISPAQTAFLNDSVTAVCDALDGAEDGLISNTKACDATFDIETLRCEDAATSSDSCFSEKQIDFLKVMNTRFETSFEMENGVKSFGRWPIFQGGDAYGIWSFGMSPEAMIPPAPVANFVLAVFSDPLIRFAAMRDPSYNSLTFNPEEHVERLQELSKIMDSNATDLSPFTDKGGKILLMHGSIDFGITPYNSIDYYNRVVETMGQDAVNDFMKFYIIPGFGHGTGKFQARWDPLTALENWVEKGEAPEGLVVSDAAKETAGRTRPLCEYPAYPALNDGANDMNSAENFHCATE